LRIEAQAGRWQLVQTRAGSTTILFDFRCAGVNFGVEVVFIPNVFQLFVHVCTAVERCGFAVFA
jgi:hypothetical protein